MVTFSLPASSVEKSSRKHLIQVLQSMVKQSKPLLHSTAKINDFVLSTAGYASLIGRRKLPPIRSAGATYRVHLQLGLSFALSMRPWSNGVQGREPLAIGELK